MSSVEPLASGNELLHYRLTERLGASVWRADDTRLGRSVAVKILTRQLPKDAARREQVIRDVRLGAALYHSFLVPIHDVVAAGDALVMVMEVVDGQPLTAKLGGQPLNRVEFFRIAIQVAEVVKLLQARNIVHGNITGDAIMITPAGQVKLGGLNLVNLLPRKEGASSPAYQQRGSDPRSVAYMAPEQIAGQAVDFRTDVFSLGVVFYEMGTGVLPWNATAPGDIAREIVEGQPKSPRAINPQIDNAVMGVIGRCLFKDSFRRQKDARAIVEDIAKTDPDAVRFASEVAAKSPTAAAGGDKAGVRNSIMLLADVAGGSDPDAATKAAAKMQQIVGEAVYLFDGQIVDPFGARLIAELPSIENALEAARKAEFDVSEEQQGDEVIPIRMLLHAGDVTTKDGAVVGDSIDKGFGVVEQLPPLKLYVSEDFVKRGRGQVRMRDAGARAGVKLYEIAPPETTTQTTIVPERTPTEEENIAPEVPRASPKHRMWISVGGALLLVGGIGGLMLSRRGSDENRAPVRAAAAVNVPHTIVLEPFSVEGAEPALLERASAIRLAAIEVLRSIPTLKVSDTPTNDAALFGAKLRAGAAGPEIVPTTNGVKAAAGPATPLPDAASGVQSVVQWVAAQAHVQPRTTNAESMNAFADSLAARANNDAAKTESSLRAAIKADPTFLPAQMMAMNFFASRGNDKDALEAAKQVAALAPENIEASRRVAQGTLKNGDITGALAAYASVLKQDANDAEAINTIGHYAAAAVDVNKFNAALARSQKVPPDAVAVHAPDMLVANGKIDTAIDQYYDIEVKTPDNRALALKIGRIAVLRRTMPVADIELGKLQKSDPDYGYPLLKAYIAASQNLKPVAENELKSALAGSKPGDDYYTSAAEIYAMLADTKNVIASLEKAADRREPTAAYILNDPLFAYLGTDAKFMSVRDTITKRQQEIQAALAQIAM
jgi:tetratricopeptide (TPR) repeat protein